MPITPFTKYPSSLVPLTFNGDMDQMISEVPSRIAQANAMEIAGTLIEVQDTSTTSNAIGTGAKTFTVTAGKSFALGMTLLIADTGAPSTNAMVGTVTSYAGTTLIMNITSIIGSGTKTAWTISQGIAVPAGLAAASQAQAEAGTADTVAITPLSANWHPGVAKAWIKAAGNGTSILASWNVTSLTDAGTGTVTVTIATDFSSADYVVLGTPEGVGTNSQVQIISNTLAAGSFYGGCANNAGTLVDPISHSYACFGDQA